MCEDVVRDMAYRTLGISSINTRILGRTENTNNLWPERIFKTAIIHNLLCSVRNQKPAHRMTHQDNLGFPSSSSSSMITLEANDEFGKPIDKGQDGCFLLSAVDSGRERTNSPLVSYAGNTCDSTRRDGCVACSMCDRPVCISGRSAMKRSE